MEEVKRTIEVMKIQHLKEVAVMKSEQEERIRKYAEEQRILINKVQMEHNKSKESQLKQINEIMNENDLAVGFANKQMEDNKKLYDTQKKMNEQLLDRLE